MYYRINNSWCARHCSKCFMLLFYYSNAQNHPTRHVLLFRPIRKLRDRKVQVFAHDFWGMRPRDHWPWHKHSKPRRLSKAHEDILIFSPNVPTHDLCSGYANMPTTHHGPPCLYLFTCCLFAWWRSSFTGRFLLIPHFLCCEAFSDSLDRAHRSSPFC